MNINLRKANAIQNSIIEAIKEVEMKTTISINEFQDPEIEIKNANVELLNNDRKRAILLTALYNIRGLVSAANHNSGIDLLLTQSALAEKRLQQLGDLTRAKETVDLKILEGKLNKIKNQESKSDGFGRYSEDEVTTGVVSRAEIKSFKDEVRSIQKQKQKYADEILELNVKTEIPLSEEVVKILTEAGIL